MFIVYGHGIENLSINLIVVNIDDVHLFTDTLESSLLTERFKIGTSETMGALSDGFKIDILSKLHILGVNTKNFHSSDLIRDANIDFSIETTCSSKGWVNGVRSISGGNNDYLSSSLGTVHESEELGNNSLLSLTV